MVLGAPVHEKHLGSSLKGVLPKSFPSAGARPVPGRCALALENSLENPRVAGQPHLLRAACSRFIGVPARGSSDSVKSAGFPNAL
jgi:hypothetical protein